MGDVMPRVGVSLAEDRSDVVKMGYTVETSHLK